MAEKTWNKNVRFNTNSESAMQAWSLLHSDEVKNGFKSQNEFIICAINDYYERYMQKKDDPYFETREKEDAFMERIIIQVTEKILTNLPTLAGMPMMNFTAGAMNTNMTGAGEQNGGCSRENGVAQGQNAGISRQEALADDEPEDNEFLDSSFGM